MRLVVPSSLTLSGLTARVILGRSSLRMVPVTAVVVPMVYPVPLPRVMSTVSSLSNTVSAVGLTVTVAVLELAVKVTLVPILP